MSLYQYTDKELEKELSERKARKEKARKKYSKPKPYKNPNFEPVIDKCAEIVERVDNKGACDEKDPSQVFEMTMRCIYGKDVFDWIHYKIHDKIGGYEPY